MSKPKAKAKAEWAVNFNGHHVASGEESDVQIEPQSWRVSCQDAGVLIMRDDDGQFKIAMDCEDEIDISCMTIAEARQLAACLIRAAEFCEEEKG